MPLSIQLSSENDLKSDKGNALNSIIFSKYNEALQDLRFSESSDRNIEGVLSHDDRTS